MKYLSSLWSFLKNKAGRLITAAGIVLSSVEAIDITAIKDPLEGLIGHKGVQALAVGLFVASYLRHQYVASQHSKADPLPAPAPQAVVKP